MPTMDVMDAVGARGAEFDPTPGRLTTAPDGAKDVTELPESGLKDLTNNPVWHPYSCPPFESPDLPAPDGYEWYKECEEGTLLLRPSLWLHRSFSSTMCNYNNLVNIGDVPTIKKELRDGEDIPLAAQYAAFSVPTVKNNCTIHDVATIINLTGVAELRSHDGFGFTGSDLVDRLIAVAREGSISDFGIGVIIVECELQASDPELPTTWGHRVVIDMNLMIVSDPAEAQSLPFSVEALREIEIVGFRDIKAIHKVDTWNEKKIKRRRLGWETATA